MNRQRDEPRRGLLGEDFPIVFPQRLISIEQHRFFCVCLWLAVAAIDIPFGLGQRGDNFNGRVVFGRLVFVVDEVFAACDLGIAQVSIAALNDEIASICSDRLAAGAFSDHFCCVFCFHGVNKYGLLLECQMFFSLLTNATSRKKAQTIEVGVFFSEVIGETFRYARCRNLRPFLYFTRDERVFKLRVVSLRPDDCRNANEVFFCHGMCVVCVCCEALRPLLPTVRRWGGGETIR